MISASAINVPRTGGEEVREKERTNFCDNFKPRPGAYVVRDDSKAQAAKAKPDGLFETTSAQTEQRAAADAACEKLDRLFGTSEKNGK